MREQRGVPAGFTSQADREVAEHRPDHSLGEGEGDALQEGGEGEGEGVKEQHAPLLPEDRQPLHLQPDLAMLQTAGWHSIASHLRFNSYHIHSLSTMSAGMPFPVPSVL